MDPDTLAELLDRERLKKQGKKRCNCCNEVFPRSHFYPKNKDRPDDLIPYCKSCALIIRNEQGRGCVKHRSLLIELQGGRCNGCSETFVLDQGHHHDLYPEVDHIVPKHHGGSDDLENLQCLCRKCNGPTGKWDNPDWIPPNPLPGYGLPPNMLAKAS